MKLAELSRKDIMLKLGLTRLEGRSMYPVLKHGDVLAINAARIDEYCLGDLIVFKKDFNQADSFVCHRLLFKSRSKFFEKGDNCIKGAWHSSSLIVGKVKDDRRNNKIYQPNRKASFIINCFFIVWLNFIITQFARIKGLFFKRSFGVGNLIKKLTMNNGVRTITMGSALES